MARRVRRSAPTALLGGWAGALVAFGLGAFGCESSDPNGADGGAAGSGGMSGGGGTAGEAGFGGGGAADTLREAAAAAGKYVGAAVSLAALRADESYAAILAREFDEVTPENAMKWEPLAPTADSYDWAEADEIVAAAEQSGQTVKGHTLVWHRQYPSWLSATMTPAELRTAMERHITTTLTRYRGRVRAWDVVNEAVDVTTASGYTESIFYEILGPDYIADAFRFARQADPDALLFYNEVGIERSGTKSNFTYELLRDLLDDGVPIDGVGFQSHISIHRYPSLTNLQSNLARFAELGLRVNLSEIDARTLLLPGDGVLRQQAQQVAMQGLTFACAVEPACEGVTFWGVTDEYSWINDEGQADEPLLFDRAGEKKPAYQGALDGLRRLRPVVGQSVLDNGDFSAGANAWEARDAELGPVPTGSGVCARSRGSEGAGIAQLDLADALEEGAFAFASEVMIDGAEVATVDALLVLEFADGAREALNIATLPAEPGDWTELSGFLGLGFDEPPIEAELVISGPPSDVELCLRGASLAPLTSR